MTPARAIREARHAVLIVDDSAVARAVIDRAIAQSGRLSVAAAVGGAAEALSFLERERVAAIVLDLAMPGVDGLTALPDLIAASAGAPVLILSSACDDLHTRAALSALPPGTTDTLDKPGAARFGGSFAQVLEDRLLRLIDGASDGRTDVDAASDFDVIAIGASTGGIHALSRVLSELSPEVRQPILVTQHLPPAFMPYFANQLALLSRRPTSVAGESSRLIAGEILIAPGDAHIRLVRTVDGAAVRLSRDPASSGCWPSVDPMLASVASVFGRRGLGIVLSGMGRDGALGAERLVAAGGCVVAQDKDTSVVWGMPGAVAEAGHAAAVLAPEAIARLVNSGRRPC